LTQRPRAQKTSTVVLKCAVVKHSSQWCGAGRQAQRYKRTTHALTCCPGS